MKARFLSLKRIPTILASLVATSLFSAVAAAAEAVAPVAPVAIPGAPAGGLVSTIVNTVIVPVLIAVTSWFTARIIKVFEKKTGVAVSEAEYKKMQDILDQGIHYAAEQAAKAADKKIASNEKMALASTYVNQAIDQWGLKKLGDDKVKAMIESRLAITKAGATAVRTPTPPPAS